MAHRRPGLILHSFTGHEYHFDPGALCLELATTGGLGPRRVFEQLHTPADLARWLPTSRLADGGRFDAADVDVDAGDLARTSELREAIWHAATRIAHDSAPPRRRDLDVISRIAGEPPLVPCIDRSGGRAWVVPLRGPQILATIARDAIDLVTGPLAARLRECDGHNCGLLFVDTSRPGARRWCSMEHCGNRDKVRAFRQRRQE